MWFEQELPLRSVPSSFDKNFFSQLFFFPAHRASSVSFDSPPVRNTTSLFYPVWTEKLAGVFLVVRIYCDSLKPGPVVS